jgi:hypothetical protein
MADRPVCFVIAPIGKDGSEARIRSDKVLKHIIGPVAEECGYEAIRADKISEPGMITTQVINHILNDPMVIADLTGNNANVFYELAVRHAIRKPYVQIIQKGETIPFDIAGMRTIDVDHTDLDSVAAAKEEIKRQMQGTAAEGAKLPESPISVAIDFDRLQRSNDPEKRQIADIVQGLNELKTMIAKMPLEIENYKRFTHAMTTLALGARRQIGRAAERPDDKYVDILEALKSSLDAAKKPSEPEEPERAE